MTALYWWPLFQNKDALAPLHDIAGEWCLNYMEKHIPIATSMLTGQEMTLELPIMETDHKKASNSLYVLPSSLTMLKTAFSDA